MNNKPLSDAIWPAEAISPGEASGNNRETLTRMPVLVVAFTLIWFGVLGGVHYLWAEGGAVLPAFISPDRAIVFFLCGTAMATARDRANISRILACGALLVSVSHLYSDLLPAAPLDAPSAFGRLPHVMASWAMLTTILSLGLVCRNLGAPGRRASFYLGIAATTGAVLDLVAQWGFSSRLYDSADAAKITAIMGILGGCAVVALSRKTSLEDVLRDRAIAITIVLGTLASVLGWHVVTEQSLRTTSHHDQAAFKRAALNVKNSIAGQLALFDRMSRRWNALDGTPPEKLVREELDSYLDSVASLSLIAVLDDNHRIQWIQSKDGVARRWLEQNLAGMDYRRWLNRMRINPGAHLGYAEAIFPKKTLAIIAAPLAGPGTQGWTIVAVENISALLSEAFGASDSPLHFRVEQNGQPLFGEAASQGYLSRVGESAISLRHGTVWTLSSWRTGPLTEGLAALLANIVLLVGLALTAFLIRTQRLASGIRHRSIQLHHGSLHDALTNLPNKRQLELQLSRVCQAAKAENAAVWVVLVNLDGMKLINDSMGHNIGDKILVEVAQRMREEVGKKGVLARIGGVEFVVVHAGVARQDVLDATRRIIAAVTGPYHIENMQFRLTASAGITVTNDHAAEPMELVREADLAMTRAKYNGRNTWHEYTTDLSALVAERLSLRTELQKFLDEDGLELHYQPLIDGSTGRIVGVEALLRWQHPTRGYIPPSVFIPLAEETGQIIPLSDWVLNTACRHIKTLKTRNLSDFPVVVNISPLHFQRTDFIDSIRKKLQTYSLPAKCLEIEITEGILLDNATHTITKLKELKEIGVAVSIDDFGTGYSSLNYLKNLPIDKIKIDRSFVNEVISDRHDAAIAKAIIDIAHHLNVKVIAEGVETESQYWFLKRNFCDQFQGYLFAKPMSFGDLEQRLKEHGGCEILPEPKYKKESDRTLLLLDDEENILRALARLLRRDGYRILTAKTPPEAFSILATHDVQVILSDQRIPEMTGTEFFSSVKKMYPATVRLILSGYTDLKSVTEAINRGSIYKFLTKPWDEEELRSEIAHAFKGYVS
ncbi:EAL domain-containing protein [Paralcaligenes sp. KSB-10]|uniref:EAL domain-containing protein n=1 Tax=Paralcaligenes sp. KSB-10 TaxID=2901142 RepID=UPI001E3D8718|nr:EAL domain-containing protein [Paralcaligenes sp. KSB-10]UHL65390.1 EAL domain-containing protein [Paralcaligenes sp. KSB-10]